MNTERDPKRASAGPSALTMVLEIFLGTLLGRIIADALPPATFLPQWLVVGVVCGLCIALVRGLHHLFRRHSSP